MSQDSTHDHAALNAAFAAVVAERVGDAWGYQTDWRLLSEGSGTLVYVEGRPFPRDFCGSLDLTVPALAALGLIWDLTGPRYAGDLAGVVVRADPWPPAADEDVSDVGQPAAIATALVRAALRVLGQEGVRGGATV